MGTFGSGGGCTLFRFLHVVLPPPELQAPLCAVAPVVKTVFSVSLESGESVWRMRTENDEG
jgi:hypothetical protein